MLNVINTSQTPKQVKGGPKMDLPFMYGFIGGLVGGTLSFFSIAGVIKFLEWLKWRQFEKWN